MININESLLYLIQIDYKSLAAQETIDQIVSQAKPIYDTNTWLLKAVDILQS